jgi:MazG family protein
VRLTFDDLIAVMAKLRAADGCPWDREQTHASLAPYLLEESHEVLEAISRGDPSALCGELGDVLLQIVFHAQMAQETGTFDITAVTDQLVHKLIDRHPHVFGDVRLGTAREVKAHWEELKRREDPDRAFFEGIPSSLPALARAQKVLERAIPDEARRRDVEKTAAAVRQRLEPALAAAANHSREPRHQDAAGQAVIGELLFAVAALAEAAGVDAEGALRRECDRVIAGKKAGD